MRQLTAYASYLDNLGAPLVGKVRFFDMDNAPSLVYHLDNATQEYIEAGNTVFTNSSGQIEPQVFLDDHDYILVFYKYVGAGTMAEDDDTESWEEQGSAVDLYNTLGVSLTGSAMRCIGTVNELRNSDPLSDNEMIALLGYNVSGDKPVVYYKWNPNSLEVDNGGSVIWRDSPRPDWIRGRWIMVECQRRLDVRHFGAFPKDSAVEDAVQRYSVQRAGEYAHDNACGLFFPATDTECNYDISGLTLYDVDCDDRARVFCITGMSSSITGIDQVFCKSSASADGVIDLIDDVIHSSWCKGSTAVAFHPGRKLYIEGQLPYRLGNIPVFRDIDVEIVDYARCTLEHCTVESIGKIDDKVEIRNCEIRTSWFTDDYDFENDLTTDGNTILIDNCKDAQTYVLLKNMQEESNYGDLKEQTIANIELLPDCLVENGFFNHVTLPGDSELHNVSGTVGLSASGPSEGKDHLWVDCWIDFFGHQTYARNFKALRGKIGLTDDEALYTSGYFHAEDVSIELNVFCNGPKLVCKGCVFMRHVAHNSSSTSIVEHVNGCTMQEGRLDILASTPGSRFADAQWTGNVGIIETPIDINRTNFDPVDSNHTYVYSGNSGTFLPSDIVRKAVTLSVTDDVTLKKNDNYVIVEEDKLGDGTESLSFYAESNTAPANYWGIPDVKLFRVGSDDFEMNCNWFQRTIGMAVRNNVVPLSFRMNMHRTADDTYKASVPTMLTPTAIVLPPVTIALVRTDAASTPTVVDGSFTFFK